jgi:hypothetical protein
MVSLVHHAGIEFPNQIFPLDLPFNMRLILYAKVSLPSEMLESISACACKWMLNFHLLYRFSLMRSEIVYLVGIHVEKVSCTIITVCMDKRLRGSTISCLHCVHAT